MQKLLSLEECKNLQGVDILTQVGTVKVVSFIYTAILDKRVCLLCASLDGKVMKATDPAYNTYQPPLHGKCRCFYQGVTDRDPNPPKINWKTPSQELVAKFGQNLKELPIKGVVTDKILPLEKEKAETKIKKKKVDIEILPIDED